MFTRIEPLIQAVIRRAEKTDAHMGLVRDESVVDGRKKNESRSAPEEWEDMTEVSVVALRGFLQELIGLAPPSSPELTTSAPDGNQVATVPENTAASRAASAYRTTGRMVHDRNVTPVSPPILTPLPIAAPSESAITGNFSPEEKEIIQGYIKALIEFEQRGIEALYLQRSTTFLESIRDAIAAAQ